MDNKLKYLSKFTLHGYTINPVQDIEWLNNFIFGLFTYSKEHLCDYGSGKKHLNYLGKQIEPPYIVKIENPGNKGLIATQYMTNGYFIIKITDDIYPAEVRFDLFLNESLNDIELIIDHLTAPAIPFDGLGVFDYKYSLSQENVMVHNLNKYDRSESSYNINEPMIKSSDGSWSVVLNELEEIKCYFCNSLATRWIISGHPCRPLESNQSNINLPVSKTLPVCIDHTNMGRNRERPNENIKDFWTNIDNQYELKKSVDDGEEYSFNVSIEDQ